MVIPISTCHAPAERVQSRFGIVRKSSFQRLKKRKAAVGQRKITPTKKLTWLVSTFSTAAVRLNDNLLWRQLLLHKKFVRVQFERRVPEQGSFNFKVAYSAGRQHVLLRGEIQKVRVYVALPGVHPPNQDLPRPFPVPRCRFECLASGTSHRTENQRRSSRRWPWCWQQQQQDGGVGVSIGTDNEDVRTNTMGCNKGNIFFRIRSFAHSLACLSLTRQQHY